MDQKVYNEYVKKKATKSHTVKDCIAAFIVGGMISCFAQFYQQILIELNLSTDTAKKLTTITLIGIAVLLTGLGVFDNIAKIAGAGTLVPITGFANAMASPAIDSKAEGFVLGVGANMFKIAGPVIVYGTVASVVYGIIYWITTI